MRVRAFFNTFAAFYQLDGPNLYAIYLETDFGKILVRNILFDFWNLFIIITFKNGFIYMFIKWRDYIVISMILE